MTYLDVAAAEVRKMLDANDVLYKGSAEAQSTGRELQAVRAERLTIIDRLIAIAAVEAGQRPPCGGDLPAEEE